MSKRDSMKDVAAAILRQWGESDSSSKAMSGPVVDAILDELMEPGEGALRAFVDAIDVAIDRHCNLAPIDAMKIAGKESFTAMLDQYEKEALGDE